MKGTEIVRPDVDVIDCPFSIVVDTREQFGYTFEGIMADAGRNHGKVTQVMRIPTVRAGLSVGDYSILGMPGVIIERKSKADLYGSVVRRGNFEGRLTRMSERPYDHAAVVVECDYRELVRSAPPFSKLRPKSLSRTLIAWSIRYPVRWWFLGGRDEATARRAAELMTFQILRRYYLDHKGDHMDDRKEILDR